MHFNKYFNKCVNLISLYCCHILSHFWRDETEADTAPFHGDPLTIRCLSATVQIKYLKINDKKENTAR